jgi:NifU-like protein involved in Fe-S cluster formation
MFERKALKAVGSYKYEPTVVNGSAIPTCGQTIRLVWQISDS